MDRDSAMDRHSSYAISTDVQLKIHEATIICQVMTHHEYRLQFRLGFSRVHVHLRAAINHLFIYLRDPKTKTII